MKSQIIFFEAYLKNKSVGYIIFNKDSGKIMKIAVEEKHRNIGIGSQLVKNIIKFSNSKISIRACLN